MAKIVRFLTVMAVCAVGVFGVVPAAHGWENVALGKPYTFNLPSNYFYIPPNPDVILTDGLFADTSQNWFWYQPATVSWIRVNQMCDAVRITVDLGEDTPIRGVMFSTCAGSCGGDLILPPDQIFILSSVTGSDTRLLTELVASDTGPGPLIPNPAGCPNYRYYTVDLHAHGRYVQFVIFPGWYEPFNGYTSQVHTDEVEVYRGETSWLDDPVPGPAVLSSTDLFLMHRLYTDRYSAGDAVIADENISEATRTQLLSDLADAETDFAGLAAVSDPSTYKAIFPLNDPHRVILGVYGALANAANKPALAGWVADPLDFLEPNQQPPASPVTAVSITAMRNESQPGVVNLTNSTTADIAASVSITGLPAGVTAAVSRVEWVDDKTVIPIMHYIAGGARYRPAASALIALTPESGSYSVTAPAGMVRQVWFDFTAAETAVAGTYTGGSIAVTSSAPTITIPLTIRILDQTFPATPVLKVSGWDYTSGDYGDQGAGNRDALINLMYAKFARRTNGLCFGHGTYHADGSMATNPDTTAFDAWIARWPAVGTSYWVMCYDSTGFPHSRDPNSPFYKAVKNWITFWANHAVSKGIAPSNISVCFADEPSTDAQIQYIIDWATPVQAADTGIQVWTNMSFPDPTQVDAALWPLVNEVCPPCQYLMPDADPPVDWDAEANIQFYRARAAEGITIELYAPYGANVYYFDPYSIRLQPWRAREISGPDSNANGSNMWAFCDAGGIKNSWNAYGSRGIYSPEYLTADSVTTSKHMEAVRLSVQDYEYLAGLSDRIAAETVANPGNPNLPDAVALLNGACSTVMDAVNADSGLWYQSKDRSIADTVRIQVGDMLDKLNPPKVGITSPANNAVIVGNVAIAADASSYGSTINRVVFLHDGVAIETDYSAPYSCTWISPPSGNYALTAKAYANDGNTAVSTAVNITVYNVTTSLYCRWNWENNTTDTAPNGTANNGTKIGATYNTDHVVGGTALNFSGSSQYMYVSSQSDLNPTGSFTICAWVKAVDWNAGRRILQKGSDGSQYRLYSNGSSLIFEAKIGGSAKTVSTSLPSTGVWHHIGVTYDGSSIKIYVDAGTPVATTASGTAATTTSTLYVGRASSAGNYWKGKMDDLRIYKDRALTRSEMQAVMSLTQ